MSQPGPVSIFIAYSRSDAALLDELRKQFAPLERVKKVKVWYDGNIEAGRDWEAEIKQAIYAADIILLLVSADSISSEYFYGKEVEAALERHARGEARVLPVILRPCAWQVTPLGRLQALPKNGWPVVNTQHWPHRDDAWDNAIAEIGRIADDITARKKADIETVLAAERKSITTLEEQKRLTDFNAALHAADQFFQSGRLQQAAEAYQNALGLWQPGYGNADALRQRITDCTTLGSSKFFTIQFGALRQRIASTAAWAAGIAAFALVVFFALKNCGTQPTQTAENPPLVSADTQATQPVGGLIISGSDSQTADNGNAATKPEPKKEEPQKNQATTSFADPFAGQMVRVQGGTFTMGSNVLNVAGPPHSVTVPSFKIGKYEVTQAQWRAVMGNNPSRFKGCDQCPVENVSWNDVQEFIKKLNNLTKKRYRLPTEAEWEYAARGGNHSQGYKYAGGDELGSVAWHSGNSTRTHSVGRKKGNELVLYDMSGNVWEWVRDVFDSYDGAPTDGSARTSGGTARVLRGGAWDLVTNDGFRVSWRNFDAPTNRDLDIGFRLAED